MKKLITLLCILPLCIALFAQSGTCGDNLTWELDDQGTLTISGTGEMDDYDDYDCSNLSPWYYYRESITKVIINDGVTSIGDWTFTGCSSLTSIIIPNSVTSIGDLAFYGCTSLTSIEIPNSVTSIRDEAFYGCSSLTSIIVEAGNPKYDSRDNCNAIIETATNTLIAGCQNTIIPNSVTSIGEGAFKGCSNLTSIVIPNSVTHIGYIAFYGCSNLTSIVIPNSVTGISGSVFSDCNSLTSIIVEAGNPYYDSRDNCNAIIWTANNTLNAGCQNTIIPNSVTSIGYGAFSGCSNLTSIVIPNSVTRIEEAAFWDCSNLTSIVIPNSVTSIGYGAFKGCSSLTSIVIPNSVTSIGYSPSFGCLSPFQGCSSLTSIIVEAGNPKYDSRDNCNALIETATNTLIAGCQNTIIPNSVTNIKRLAFYECNKLTSIEIPNSVTSIGYGAFKGCSSLTSIVIPNSVTSIGEVAFSGCSSLTSIFIPNSVTSIVERAFYGCSSLTSIIVEAGNPGYDSRDNCNAIIKTASKTLIAGCQNTIIPNSVTSIGEVAFSGCSSLTSIEIPNSVKNIGEYAFAYCKNLNKVTCYATTPPQIASDAFGYVNTSIIALYVPAESVELYKAAEVWKEFDIRAIGDSASFTVNFVGFNGADLGSQKVAKGDSAIAPDPQTPKGYTFIGWDKDFYNVQSDMTITAIYSQNTSNETINITNDVYVSIYQNNEAEYSEKNINLAAGSAFIVDTLVNLEVGTITQNINLSSAASIFACAENLSADTLKIQFDIKTGIWYYLCFPFDIPFNNISSLGQYVIYEYDGATRAQKGSGGWQRTTSGKFTAMKGYIFQASENGTLIITIENPQFPCFAETILPVYASQYQQHANWSLIGNPYPSYYNMGALRVFSKFNAPVYVRCKDKDDYDVYIPADDEYHFRPYEAFFVQNPNNVQSTIYWDILGCETASQIGIKPNNIIRRERQAEQNRYFVEITLVGNNSDDHTRVVFNDEAGAEYELGRDAVKMDGSAPVRLYTLDAQTLYAINEQPTSNKAISLGYKVAADGEYTLSASRMDKEVEIYDNELQQVVDLRQGDYTFTTQAGVNNTRFTISVKANMPTGINSDIATDEHVTIYTITGIMLYDNVMLNDIQLQSGIYIIKSATKIEKVVVK